jgi:hypothetical protein
VHEAFSLSLMSASAFGLVCGGINLLLQAHQSALVSICLRKGMVLLELTELKVTIKQILY